MINQQTINIPFSQGLDTKTDPKQVALGRFLVLENSVFGTTGLLQKRNGFGTISALPDNTYTYLTTFNDNLTAIGTKLSAYTPNLFQKTSNSQVLSAWTQKGTLQPVQLSVLPTVRSATNQTQSDSVTSPNGLLCTVYTDVNANVTTYNYVIANASTGQNILAPTAIIPTAGAINSAPKIYLLGSYFIIVFSTLISSVNNLEYVAINYNTGNINAAVSISANFTPASTINFDAVVSNNTLYLAWNGNDGGGAIRMRTLSSTLALGGQTVVATGVAATIMSVTVDETASPSVVWASFYNSATSTGYVLAEQQVVGGALSPILTATQIISSGSVANITTTAQSGILNVFYEINNNYGYDSAIPTNYLKKNTVTQAGVVGSSSIMARSVGLASKAFIMNSNSYMLTTYDGKSATSSALQPTNFLMDANGNVIAKLAYSNAGGYLTTGLPSVSISNTTAQISYLYRDLIASVNKEQGVANSAGIYAQTGVNQVSFNFTTAGITSSEIGNNLNITGGIVWAYDGVTSNEQNFFLWADSVEASYTVNSVVTPTGTFASGAKTVTVSSVSGVAVGMTITDTSNTTYIPTGTVITSINGTVLTISNATIHAASGDNLSIQGNIAAKPDGSTNTNAYFYQVLYQWTDAQGNLFQSAPSIPVAVTTTGSAATGTITLNIPTLRLTYKTTTPVKIVIYRWSVANQEYFQTTSITNPLLNNTAVDYVTYVDTLPDASIIGNSLIYTTGGVIEDVAPPAAKTLTLFDDRLWLVDAEDPNLLWYSKQIIEGTPVEMSDLLTFYVAPTVGAQGNTGPITALAPMDDKLVIFKTDALYWINGSGPDNTGQNSSYSQPIFITSTVGSVDQGSIVLMPNGLMFSSDKGIWLLNRNLETIYIGAPVQAFNGEVVNSALTIPGTNEVRFTLDGNTTLLYDYYQGQWGTFVGIPGISSCLYQGLHTYIDQFGRVFQETPGVYLDGSNPILQRVVTSWFATAGINGFQRLFDFYLLGTYESPHKLNVQVAYDYGYPTDEVLITPTNYSGVYGADSLYGMTSPYGGPGTLEQWRIPVSTQKCQSFQISISEVYDPSFGNTAGAGFTMSAITCVVGSIRGTRPIKAANTAGTT